MNSKPEVKLDVDLTARDITELNSSDAIAALFARLGYNTEARIVQAPSNLGITSEKIVRAIKRIELIANQEGLFQVYLFELNTVTVTGTRALSKAFRNLSGNDLLVLTSDYERLDFVLLERVLPTRDNGESAIGQRQVSIRPRPLTIDRRKPDRSRVELRVLKRLTWTESDPYAQFDKLSFAYSTAEWSEDLFNNRALFSDHYLTDRLRELPEWKEDPKPDALELRRLYQGASASFSGKSEDALRTGLLEPVFVVLGFHAVKQRESKENYFEPDYLLYSPGDSKIPVAACLTYPWGRSLDGKDYVRDTETPEENPGAVVVTLLEKGVALWAVVTNGKLWRLYSQKTHSRATNYYEIDLDEVLAQGATDFAEAFRYFWLVFRCKSFERVQRDGKETSFLSDLLIESEEYAKKLGAQLKDQVFEEVFPHLAEGFIQFIRTRDEANTDLSQPALNRIFHGTLTLLYRLLFLLYAEARDLLPVREARGYSEVSFSKIKREIDSAAGPIEDEVDGNLKKQYRDDEHGLYERLQNLFRMIDVGNASLNVPVYNGGLFVFEPDPSDMGLEAEAARFLNKNKVADRFLARAIELLARATDEKRHDRVFIDYKSLGVRQLGSIYEGLLEFKVRIANQKLAIIKEKGKEIYSDFSDLDDKEKERAERQGRLVKRGRVYLENDKKERKATGSYYTPDYIVKYIVEHAVGPMLNERFEAMRPKFRQAQREYRDFQKRQESLIASGLKPEPAQKIHLIGRNLVDEMFNVKILDPAMGSGHFLVEVVDYITDKTLDFLNAFPRNPVTTHLSQTREVILKEMEDQEITIDPGRLTDVNLLKRHVLKRCIYGVDLNPMAVELAKVSLWLDCFTLGAPLSFLDHHLRCGNSLIGVTVKEVKNALEEKQIEMFGGRFAGLKLAAVGMAAIGAMPDVTSAQVRQSRSEYRKASPALTPFKHILDVYCSQWFLNDALASRKQRGKQNESPVLTFLKSEEIENFLKAYDEPTLKRAVAGLPAQYHLIEESASKASATKRFFHWELEFPEVFYGARTGERMDMAGFDAVIGNPPYVRQEGLGEDKPFFQATHAAVYSGVADLYVYFYHRGLTVCRKGGRFGMITSNKFLRAGYAKALRIFLARHAVSDIIDFRDLPVFPEATAYPLIFIAKQEEPAQSDTFETHTVGDMEEAPRIESIMRSSASRLSIQDLRQDGWSLENPKLLRLLDKIRAAGRPLGDVIGGKFYRGILTGLNEAFVIDEAKRAELIAQDPKSAEIIKPFLRGRDIKRWHVEWAGLYLIFTRRGTNIDKYTAIKQHLLAFKKRLTPGIEGGRKPGTYKWFETQDSIDYYAEFDKPKIIYPDIYEHQSFALDTSGSLCTNTTYFIPTDDKALLAILNSKLIEFYYSHTSAQVRGGYMRAFSTYIGQIPIPEMSDADRQFLTDQTKNILDNPGNTSLIAEAENRINDTVYDLYRLTTDEIEALKGTN